MDWAWGLTERPPRNPDLVAYDLVLCRWAKEEVCWSKPRTCDEMDRKMYDSFATVTLGFLEKSLGCVYSGLH